MAMTARMTSPGHKQGADAEARHVDGRGVVGVAQDVPWLGLRCVSHEFVSTVRVSEVAPTGAVTGVPRGGSGGRPSRPFVAQQPHGRGVCTQPGASRSVQIPTAAREVAGARCMRVTLTCGAGRGRPPALLRGQSVQPAPCLLRDWRGGRGLLSHPHSVTGDGVPTQDSKTRHNNTTQ